MRSVCIDLVLIMTNSDSQETSPLFNLNYVFEPRWGTSNFENDHVLELSDLKTEAKIEVSFADNTQKLLGRVSTLPTDDLDEGEGEAETTISTVSAEFRQQLMKLAAASEEEQQRAENLRTATLPIIDLRPFYAHMYGVSRRHAALEKDGRRITVTDLRSRNGTSLNGTALFPMQRRIVRDGDELQLGNLRLRVTFRKVDAEG